MSSADNLEIVWTQIRSDKMSGQLSGHKLANSKTVVVQEIFEKLILKKLADDKKCDKVASMH